ncbi:MAG TPA: type II toxin-antitoxin system VapC family toxin [Thermoplasmata archaeon]|nr:type II toxin-antitoxin system VapC family toxin [Thermoplasmata archaeon]
MTISIDSYGWLERLLDGPKAAQYNRVFSSISPDQIVTSVVTVYEVYRKLRPLKGESAALEAVVHLRATRLVPVDDQLALEAADYSLSHHLHFADALVYATARRFGAELHTSDTDLRGVPGVTVH